VFLAIFAVNQTYAQTLLDHPGLIVVHGSWMEAVGAFVDSQHHQL